MFYLFYRKLSAGSGFYLLYFNSAKVRLTFCSQVDVQGSFLSPALSTYIYSKKTLLPVKQQTLVLTVASHFQTRVSFTRTAVCSQTANQLKRAEKHHGTSVCGANLHLSARAEKCFKRKNGCGMITVCIRKRCSFNERMFFFLENKIDFISNNSSRHFTGLPLNRLMRNLDRF